MSLVRLKIIQCAKETGWGWRAEMWNFACESIQATTVYWLHLTSMNAASNIDFHIYKTSLQPVEWLGKAFKFLSWTKEGNWYLASHRTHFRGMLFRTAQYTLFRIPYMVNTKKDILNPLDRLHHDPQKLYEKRVHQSTQIWPRNGGKSFRVLVSLHDLLRASRMNKEALLLLHSRHRSLSHFRWLLCSPPAPAAASRSLAAAAAQWASIQSILTNRNGNRLANTVFSRVSTWHILSDFKEERKESGGSHFYHPMTMFQPWMKIPLSQLLFLFSGLLEHCNKLVIICFHSRKSAKL